MSGFQQVDVARNQFDSKGIELALQSMGQNLQNFYSTGTINEIGAIVAYAGAIPPTGWLIADGSAVSRTTFSALFAVIGTTYGVGDGSTTFNLPDLKGRVAVGRDSGQTEFDTLGEKGGHKLLQSHTHGSITLTPSASTTANTAVKGGAGTPDYTATTASTGGGDSQNLQPYQVINYIVRYALPASSPAILPKVPYAFSTYRTASASSASNAFADVICDSVLFDVGSNYNINTGIFTCTQNGLYQFNFSVTSIGAITRWLSALYKNGNSIEIARGVDFAVSANPATSVGSVLCQLNSGDTVKLRIYANAVISLQPGEQYTKFNGYLVSAL